MRQPEESFVRQLKAYDPLLDVVWCEFEPNIGAHVQRWRIIRKGRDGLPRHIMFVQDKRTGGYQPLDNRVLERLHECDSHRFVDADEMVNAMEASEDEARKYAIGGVYDRRYWDGVAEMGERLQALAKDSPFTGGSEKEVTRRLKQADAAEEVRAAYKAGKGEIVLDRELGCARLVPGSDS